MVDAVTIKYVRDKFLVLLGSRKFLALFLAGAGPHIAGLNLSDFQLSLVLLAGVVYAVLQTVDDYVTGVHIEEEPQA